MSSLHQRLMLALRSLRDVPLSCTSSTPAAVAVRMQRLSERFANLCEPLRCVTLVYEQRKSIVCRVEWHGREEVGCMD